MTPEERYQERLKWFTDRIGKKVWRPRTTCKCSSCEDTYLNGLEIHDEYHAGYVRDVEAEYGIESKGKFRYFDTKEERDKFEQDNLSPLA